jgi:peptidoglycan-associated lipoprotein
MPMINRIIDFSVEHKLAVLAIIVVACIGGWWAMVTLPLDAIPDLSDTQVIVFSRWDRSPDINALQADSTELRDILKDFPDYKLTIEGNCDERGSAEYNLALGDARAKAAKDYLVQVGIPDDQLSIISYGKERPVCQEHDEACWQKNRRIHIVAMTASR